MQCWICTEMLVVMLIIITLLQYNHHSKANLSKITVSSIFIKYAPDIDQPKANYTPTTNTQLQRESSGGTDKSFVLLRETNLLFN